MLVNGSPCETIAINDRGLSYGDGLFETIRLHKHKPVLLEAHLDRLCSGARRLRIDVERATLIQEIDQLTASFPVAGILKIMVTRGTGGRGYLPNGISSSTRILSLHAIPIYDEGLPEAGISVFVCQQRLAHQPALAGIKHLNRLEQVMASLEWPDDSYQEGLMLDVAGNVIEGTRSNLFWSAGGQLMTPSLQRCGVAGILRQYLMQHIDHVLETDECSLAMLGEAEEIFFCNSVFGIWPVNRIQSGDSNMVFHQDRRAFSVKARSLFADLLAAC